MITQPKFAVLYVVDQARLLEFFSGTLGFEVLTDAPYGEGARWVEVRPPGARTYLVLAAEDAELAEQIRLRRGPMSTVWFDSDDLDATFAELSAKGVSFPVEPQAAPWDPGGSTRWAQFADPEGNLYGISAQDG
ncbi:VOC family protein [Saccharopolyspora sp. NFXS83]|uniref:VOC family protein n=1 Tax=Saccharopolyspora sp. NFXS83 TaxID=2993560 RepID=UPI00224B699F|nr:VOC family protein [Saccharopolyspora sp. NFXS83]MCX2732799.1 VOC family protein [Saccharopolyspora sp. NFXS83]